MSTTTTYKCKNCGGGLIYDPSTDKLKCEYCLTKYSKSDFVKEVSTSKKKPTEKGHATSTGFEDQMDNEQLQYSETYNQYHCPNCGADILTEETTSATFCYYCHNPVILNGKISGKYMPNKIIPFAINKKDAVTRFKSWIGKKKFLVSGFYSKQQVDRITGVYIPYWLFNCDLEGYLAATSKDTHTYFQDGEKYTETEVYRTDRHGDLLIQNMPYLAITSQCKDIINNMLPYDWSNLQKFDKKYLLGFQAEKRNIGKKYFEEEIESDIKKLTTESLKKYITGYDKIKVEDCAITINASKCDYVLLPVYLLTYQYRNNLFYFTMNGQTGKIIGKLPFNLAKLIICSVIIFIVVFSILLCMGLYIW